MFTFQLLLKTAESQKQNSLLEAQVESSFGTEVVGIFQFLLGNTGRTSVVGIFQFLLEVLIEHMVFAYFSFC